jgi:hypothetical protein
MPCVYFIRKSNRDVYKIGMTASYAEGRLKDLQTGSEEALTLYASIRCNSAHVAVQVERHLHTAFARQRMYGEWFSMTPADVDSALRAYKTTGYKVEYHKVTVSRTAPRFIVGSDRRARDTEGAALRRALARVAAVEKANQELTGPRMEQIRRLEWRVEVQGRQIARLKRQLAYARRPKWRKWLRQFWGFLTLNPPEE